MRNAGAVEAAGDDGRVLLACACMDGVVRLWDPTTGELLLSVVASASAHVTTVVFGRMPDGRDVMASGTHDGIVQLWDRPPAML